MALAFPASGSISFKGSDMQFNIIASALSALALVFVTLQPAHADLRVWHLRGEITTAEADNRFGLQTGDKLFGHITLDTLGAKLTGQGFESRRADQFGFVDMGLQIGKFSFDEDDHSSIFGPHFIFENGELISIAFQATFQLPEFDTPDLITLYDFVIPVDTFSPHFLFGGPGIEDVVGSLLILPEPGALATFAIGLAGMRLLRRRRDVRTA
jgi:hypothetical protein